jgi:hypothetical protein
VIGDSNIIINHARMNTLPKNNQLRSIFLRIRKKNQKFHKVEFLHALKVNIREADFYANQDTRKNPWVIIINMVS